MCVAECSGGGGRARGAGLGVWGWLETHLITCLGSSSDVHPDSVRVGFEMDKA